MANRLLFTSLLLACVAPLPSAATAENREPAAITTLEATLERFAADYAGDPMAEDLRFGIEVDGHRWTVTSDSASGERQVELVRGFGSEPLFYFKTDRETLNLIDQGVWSAGTAMGAATSADRTPLDVLYTEGYIRDANHEGRFRRLLFHFWTKGFPEVVPTGVQHARVVHGAPAALLYYDDNLRSAVYHIPAGLGRDQAPTLAVPFPRMIVVTAGSAEGDAGGKPFVAKQGEMVFMAPGIPVTFWNARQDEALSFVWLMWGDGA